MMNEEQKIVVKEYFFDDEENLWANIHCNGRRQWRTVVDCDCQHPLYQAFANPLTKGKKAMIEKYCLEHGFAEEMAKLPHIEDASQPMQDAWRGADEWDQPFTNLGYYEDDEQFLDYYGMPKEEFQKQLQADIDKYCIGSEIERRYGGEYLYSVTWWLCELFTAPVEN